MAPAVAVDSSELIVQGNKIDKVSFINPKSKFRNLQSAIQGETLPTVRQKIIDLLREGELDARELSREVGIREKEVYDHLAHIARSLAVKGNKLNIQPARCLSCDYVFKDRQRFTRPGRCPRCRKSHLQSPAYFIE